MYFTLAVSAATAARCAALTSAALDADPRVMPVPGPALVAWRAPDGRATVLHWGDQAPVSWLSRGLPSVGLPSVGLPSGGRCPGGMSHAGTIWPEGAAVCARTALTRVDPVYLAEEPGAVVVSDRASWAAAVTGRLRDPDPVMTGAFLSLGYPVGGGTAGVPAPVAAGPAPVRGPRGPGRARRPAPVPDERPVAPRHARPAVPRTAWHPAGWRAMARRAADPGHRAHRPAAVRPQQAAAADWRRDPAGTVAGFLRGYVLDHGEASVLFGVVSRRAAERSLALPQADPLVAWALATLAALLSGDWLSAREPAARTTAAAPDAGRS